MTDQLRNAPSSALSSSPSSSPALCAGECGFFGNAKTENYCSKCYKDVVKKRAEGDRQRLIAVQDHKEEEHINSSMSISDPEGITVVTDTSSSPSSAAPSLASSLTTPLSADALSPLPSPSMPAAPAPSPFARAETCDTFSLSLTAPLPPTSAVASPSSASDAKPAIPSSPSSPMSLSLLSLSSPSTGSAASSPLFVPSASIPIPIPSATPPPSSSSPSPTSASPSSSSPSSGPPKNRCTFCNKKVGLTYFPCKCNDHAMFCASHRYPHAHNCTFDIRSFGKDKIAKANPIVKNAQFEKI